MAEILETLSPSIKKLMVELYHFNMRLSKQK